MTTERDANRARYPEFTEAVDYLRSIGATIENAWIEDADGVVLAGKRPASAMDECWLDADKLMQMRADFAPREPKRGRNQRL